MRQLSVFLWVLFGVVVGHQLRQPQTIIKEVPKAVPPQIQTITKEVIKKVPVEVPGKCDYQAYEQAISDLQGALDKQASPIYRDVVIPVYTPVQAVKTQTKTSSLTVLLSLGEGVKSADIKTSADGNTLYPEPKKGMVGGISAYYKFAPFTVFTIPVNGLTIGGGLMGAETKYGSVGYTWTFP
jgi:hypothetical protein